MAWNNHQSGPFSEFIRFMDNAGAARPGPGVDQPANAGGFNFGGHGDFGQFGGPHPQGPGFGPFGGPFGGPFTHHGPFGPHHGPHGFGGGFGRRGGRCGPRGRHCRGNNNNNNGDNDAEHSGEEEQQARGANFNSENEKSGDPETSVPNEGDDFDHHHHHGPWEGGRRGGRRHRHRGPPPPGFAGFTSPDGGFDLNALLGAFANHPIAQALKGFAEQASGQNTSGPAGVDSENTFTPPIDVFSTPSAYILHIALPGAKKEDVGVNWDSDKSELNIAGVVYRAGDEEFLKTLSKSERKVGMFERSIKLPPGTEEKEEVDGDAINAKLEDGVLVVTVPKVEKDWTEVKKVDIQ